jgi:hypothetical protein
MSNTNTISPSEALDLLVQAVEAAQSRGVYSIQDAVNIAFAINTLRELHPTQTQETVETKGGDSMK